MKVADKSSENVAKFKHLGMMETNQNCIHQEIKRRLHMRNVCYHSVQNLLSSHLLSKNVNIKLYKTIIILLFFMDVKLGLSCQERVFENRVLRIIFNRYEVMRGWRKLRNEELHNLYSSSNIIRMIKSRMRWVEHVLHMGEMRNAHKILVEKPEGRRPLGRPRNKREDKI
jgi:hypothetical protein